MLRKLYGLFIYKLQYTSFFSIMQRVSGFLLLVVLYYFFLQEIFLNSFFYSSLSSYFYYFSFFILLIIVFYFSIHFLNGMRIYFTSLYYNYNLQKKPLSLNLLYSLRIVENNKVIKFLITGLINSSEFIKNFFVKSNTSFLIINYLLFFLIILFFLV
jgi:succinate dehydrogenase/fumarate reductase cytochrome b subunit